MRDFSQEIISEVDNAIEKFGAVRTSVLCAHIIQCVIKLNMKGKICFPEDFKENWYLSDLKEEFLECFLERVRLQLMTCLGLPNQQGIYKYGYYIKDVLKDIYLDPRVKEILKQQ